MNDYPNLIKGQLASIVDEMASDPSRFSKNPHKDFTRNRKLGFKTLIHTMLSMECGCIRNDLYKINQYRLDTPTVAAFVQQRDKLLPFAFQHLLRQLAQLATPILHDGYRLLAVDGSAVHAPTAPNDTESYIQTKPDAKGYNLFHLNALYDLCGRLYLDACVQPVRQANEISAFLDLVDRSQIPGKVIVTADRGYENYNVFAHVQEKGWFYIIRVKNPDSNGIVHGLSIPDTPEFDQSFTKVLTRRQTKTTRANPERYRFIHPYTRFDFMDPNTLQYPFSFRVVKLKLSDTCFETVMTNLDSIEFPPHRLKALYCMRWGIETSFRELKYTIGLTSFHSKKAKCIVQEIFARMVVYNYCEMITAHVVIIRNPMKHVYQVNFTAAMQICRYFLQCRDPVPPPDVEALIQRNVLPVRKDRHYPRNIRGKASVSFLYRTA